MPSAASLSLVLLTLSTGSRAATGSCSGGGQTARYALEDAALREFYQSAGGSAWTRSQQWLDASVSHCEWNLVSCDCLDNTTEYVVALDLGSNGLTGVLPPSLKDLSGLQRFDCQENAISGTIPTELVSLQNLTTLSLSSNRISGTVPPLPHSLHTLILSMNDLEGLLPAELSALLELETIVTDFNLVDIDLSVFTHWPKLKFASLHDCAISGSIPQNMLDNSGSLQALMLEHNHLEGTLPDAMFENTTQLKALGLSGQAHAAISGTLPQSFAKLTQLGTLLSSNLRLSGTIPGTAQVRAGEDLFSDLRVINLFRNYIQGSADVLSRSPNLETVTLTNNWLSCTMPPLNDAHGLGVGVFKPGKQYTNLIGEYLIATGQITRNPWESLRNLQLSNTYVAFGANHLTTSAGYLPPSPEPYSLTRELVKDGQHELFPGYSKLKTFLWISLPGYLVFYCVAAILSTKVEDQTYWAAAKNYFVVRRFFQYEGRNVYTRALGIGFVTSCVFSCLGLLMMAFYLTVATIYECTDPFLRSTLAAWAVDDNKTAATWTWMVLAMLMQLCPMLHLQSLMDDARSQRAVKVLRVLNCLAYRTLGPTKDVVDRWKSQGLVKNQKKHFCSEVKIRQVLFVVGIGVVAAILSIPTFLFVIALNISTSGQIVWVFFSNSTLFALTQLGLNSIVIPPATSFLAWVYGGKPSVQKMDETEFGIATNRWIVQAAFALKVLSIDITAMVATLVMDESCLRGWLFFDQDVRDLAETWKLDMMGIEAYRPQTCVRRVVTSYAYVWLQTLCMEALLFPAIELVLQHPRVYKFIEKRKARVRQLSKLEAPSEFQIARSEAVEMQHAIVSLQCQALTLYLFSIAIPAFAVLSPIILIFQLLARHRLEAPQPSWVAGWVSGKSVGRQLARNVLVHIDLWSMRTWILGSNMIFTGSIMFDMGFSLTQLITYTVFVVAQFGAANWFARVHGLFYYLEKCGLSRRRRRPVLPTVQRTPEQDMSLDLKQDMPPDSIKTPDKIRFTPRDAVAKRFAVPSAPQFHAEDAAAKESASKKLALLKAQKQRGLVADDAFRASKNQIMIEYSRRKKWNHQYRTGLITIQQHEALCQHDRHQSQDVFDRWLGVGKFDTRDQEEIDTGAWQIETDTRTVSDAPVLELNVLRSYGRHQKMDRDDHQSDCEQATEKSGVIFV